MYVRTLYIHPHKYAIHTERIYSHIYHCLSLLPLCRHFGHTVCVRAIRRHRLHLSPRLTGYRPAGLTGTCRFRQRYLPFHVKILGCLSQHTCRFILRYLMTLHLNLVVGVAEFPPKKQSKSLNFPKLRLLYVHKIM